MQATACSVGCAPRTRTSIRRSVKRASTGSQRSETLSTARRIFLLSVSCALLTGCATLIFHFRAIPKNVLFAMIFAVLYTVVANSLQPTSTQRQGKDVSPLAASQQLSRNAVRFCLLSSLLLSLVLPWTWILAFSPSPQQTKLLAPHLFLMMTQVLFEIWSYRPSVSVLVRISIPVAFVSYRLVVLYQWVREAAAVCCDEARSGAMLSLAVANVGFWSIILFYVLLLKVCPPYFLVNRAAPESGKNK